MLASFFAGDYILTDAGSILWRNLYTTLTNSHNLATFGFLIMLGTLTIIMAQMGGILAYTNAVQGSITSKKKAEISTLLLSPLFFIDDYINSLTVGSIMKPITDKFNIARAKLAYLLDAMSGSLCLLIPASSWLAIILPQLKNSGLSLSIKDSPKILADGFNTYLVSIPFMFYPIITIITAWSFIMLGISYGSMKKHELAAAKGDLFNGKKAICHDIAPSTDGSLSYFALPLGSFILSIAIGIAFTGNSWIFGGKNSFIQTVQQADILFVLFYSSVFSVIFSSLFFIAKKKMSTYDLFVSIKNGGYFMHNSILTLSLAWTFAAILKNNLETGADLADALLGTVEIALLPGMFFLTATLIAAATGSSWSTITIMLPITITMLFQFSPSFASLIPEQVPLLYPTLGAIFSGSLAGAHFSPISDTTITASTSAGCYHIDHIKTQIGYLAPSFIGTLLAYIAAGYLANYPLGFFIALLIGLLPLGIIIFIYKNHK